MLLHVECEQIGGWGKQAPRKTKEELRTKLGSEVPFKQPVAYILERNRNDEGDMSIAFVSFHSFFFFFASPNKWIS